MSFTGYLRYTTGSTLYVKPLPLNNSPWSTGVITGTENGTLGSYAFAALTEGTEYEVFKRAGGSPANTDLPVGSISYSNLAVVEAEVGKIPRKATAIAAGAAATKTNTAITPNQSITETIT